MTSVTIIDSNKFSSIQQASPILQSLNQFNAWSSETLFSNFVWGYNYKFNNKNNNNNNDDDDDDDDDNNNNNVHSI